MMGDVISIDTREKAVESLLPPCNCGRPVNAGGCSGCGMHPLDCGCPDVEEE
jgi:hypothetical protein